MAANGYIPTSWLKSLPGSNIGLEKPLAYQYWAMHYESLRRGYGSLAIYDGPVGRTYRSYSKQVLAKAVYGNNAADPGTSNHGLAKAVDLHNWTQRAAVDRVGEPYGWAKKWSDASWEYWHLRGLDVPGFGPKPDPFKPLTKKERKIAERYRYHLRERRREAKSGKGPRWRRHNKWANYYFERIRRQMRRIYNEAHLPERRGGGWSKYHRGQRYQILSKLLRKNRK